MRTSVATGEQETPDPRRRPTPWQVRITLVRVLSEHADGLTIRELERQVAKTLGRPLIDPVDADIESLLELGVLTESSADDRLLKPTEAAARYLAGAEVLASE